VRLEAHQLDPLADVAETGPGLQAVEVELADRAGLEAQVHQVGELVLGDLVVDGRDTGDIATEEARQVKDVAELADEHGAPGRVDAPDLGVGPLAEVARNHVERAELLARDDVRGHAVDPAEALHEAALTPRPMFLGHLREFPRLLRGVGRGLLDVDRDAAAQHDGRDLVLHGRRADDEDAVGLLLVEHSLGVYVDLARAEVARGALGLRAVEVAHRDQVDLRHLVDVGVDGTGRESTSTDERQSCLLHLVGHLKVLLVITRHTSARTCLSLPIVVTPAYCAPTRRNPPCVQSRCVARSPRPCAVAGSERFRVIAARRAHVQTRSRSTEAWFGGRYCNAERTRRPGDAPGLPLRGAGHAARLMA